MTERSPIVVKQCGCLVDMSGSAGTSPNTGVQGFWLCTFHKVQMEIKQNNLYGAINVLKIKVRIPCISKLDLCFGGGVVNGQTCASAIDGAYFQGEALFLHFMVFEKQLIGPAWNNDGCYDPSFKIKVANHRSMQQTSLKTSQKS